MNKDKVRLLDISDFYGFHTGGIATFINNKARIFQELGLPVEHRVVFHPTTTAFTNGSEVRSYRSSL